MMRYSAYLILALLFALAVELFLAHVWTSAERRLEGLAWGGGVITGAVAFVALIGFIYQVERDRNISAADLIGFFREKVLTEKNTFDEEVLKISPDYKFYEHCIELKKLKLWWLRLYHRESAVKQDAIANTSPEIKNELLKVLNLLEEFSLRVRYMGLTHHPALTSVRAAYVSVVEENSSFILSYHLLHPGAYPGVRRLYISWRKYGDRSSQQQQADRAVALVTQEVTREKRRIDRVTGLKKLFKLVP